jgi:glutamyl-Q tRNA(Asp) synthetase
MARQAGGRFLLRIEDIDSTRARAHWEDQIYDDLRWLGLEWDDTPLRQSDRLAPYRNALDRLWSMGVIYPCGCTRRDITQALSAPQEGVPPVYGPDGLIYPGTCRPAAHVAPAPMAPNTALRLNMQRAVDLIGGDVIEFKETLFDGPSQIALQDLPQTVGDIILSRRDFPGSYHLSVVLDDAAQQITDVVRGADLFEATQIHVLLQKLLDLPSPRYHHHPLIRDDQGKRLAKRDDARALSKYRAEGASPADIRAMVGL